MPFVQSRANFAPMQGVYEGFSNPELMKKIAIAESNENPLAYNPEWHYKDGKKYCQGSYSLFQIACIWYKQDGIPMNKYFDPQVNVTLAKKVAEQQGLSAWSVCKNGKVDCGI